MYECLDKNKRFIDDQLTYDRSPGKENKCIVTKNWRNTYLFFKRRKMRKIVINNEVIDYGKNNQKIPSRHVFFKLRFYNFFSTFTFLKKSKIMKFRLKNFFWQI